MLYRYTEAQTMDFIHVSNIAVQRVYDMTSTFFSNSPIQREDITQLRFIITTAGPSNAGQIHIIRYSKILKRAEKLSFNGFRKTDLGSNASAKVIQNVLTVHTFRCGRKPQ